MGKCEVEKLAREALLRYYGKGDSRSYEQDHINHIVNGFALAVEMLRDFYQSKDDDTPQQYLTGISSAYYLLRSKMESGK